MPKAHNLYPAALATLTSSFSGAYNVDFTDLDIEGDGGTYRIIVQQTQTVGYSANSTLRIYTNGNYTNSNYISSNVVETAQSIADPIIHVCNVGHQCTSIIDIVKHSSTYSQFMTIRTVDWLITGTDTVTQKFSTIVRNTGGTANITSIRLDPTGTVGAGLARLYKMG